MNTWIRKYGDPILRKICHPVEKIGKLEKQIFFQMAEVLFKSQALGIAAPQIGFSQRIIAVRTDGYLLQLANPFILEKEGESILTEGCLSIPEVFIKVPRFEKIKIQGLDETGKKRTVKVEGILARALQHEIDHLNGILIIDYATEKKKEKIMHRLNQIAEHTRMLLKIKNRK
ncbi:MAG TPA: peptide deformylase [Candidatus Aerophobetes bacterium]|uniref:Peptide deformylase n=1 Tax=Aerophobetes bacterium TaxID=2030807 RepID=A0A7V5I002_UNCAE|nr:peptide deformylase [Candidatus Aerophobetes bacterium]